MACEYKWLTQMVALGKSSKENYHFFIFYPLEVLGSEFTTSCSKLEKINSCETFVWEFIQD